MVLFTKRKNLPLEEVTTLKEQGLSDNQIIDELKRRGYSLPQISDALAQTAIAAPGNPGEMSSPVEGQVMSPEGTSPEVVPSEPTSAPPVAHLEELEGRIEEIVESVIDEKWDLLIKEVKKILEWKEKKEDEIKALGRDIEKLKDDFKELHQGVLGKLESYDERMIEVGTELKAVGKVFKEVVPEFVEQVKELRSITKNIKRKK